jgi:hypothetical protein
MRAGWTDPESAPGIVVTRHPGESVAAYARGFARLPVHDGASLAHARHRVALRPIDVVLSAYEDLAQIRLDGPREEPLDGPEWSWLIEVILPKGFRRGDESARAIGARGRGVKWSARNLDRTAIRRDDIVLLGDHTAILQKDDGDGWLGNQDRVVHTATGEVAEGALAELPGETFRIVRFRDFHQLRIDLTEAGYGDLGQSFPFGADLRRAVREFESDHGLPVDGRPDPELFGRLATFLERLRHPEPVGTEGR